MSTLPLLRRGNAWIPYDVVIDEVSIVGNYRIQFDKVIRNQSYEALAKKMRLKRESEGVGTGDQEGVDVAAPPLRHGAGQAHAPPMPAR
ncbi:MAG: ABC transporter substrate-binding protein [Candidatus Methylomirabilis sp.]|nr:ABC transporter substrate-binding protein [Candidatus Methylomirabilis sp.]